MPTFRFILIAALATACGHIGGFRCPARGGPAWREYRSRHFLLDTDLSDSDAQVLIEDLETLHALELQAMLGEQVEIPGHVLVVVPAEHRLFAGLADAANIGHRSSEREGGPTIGGYFKVSPLGQPMIVLPRGRNAWDRETIAHELVHHISAYL